MSAKLLKSLAEGKCTVTNRVTSEVIVYWPTDKGVSHLVISPTMPPVDLTKFATIAQLRKSQNLKKLVNSGFLSVV
jgi:hypothetical protein